MANHPDHHDDQDQSRPFLASTEAHQATLMKNTKGDHDTLAAADDPAPMLPPMVNHDAIDFLPVQKDNQPIANEMPSILNHQLDEPSSEESHEASHTSPVNYYPNSRRVIAGTTAMLVVLLGFSAVWFNVNQDIYTLGGSDGDQGSSSKVANNPTHPQSTHPATLGAGTTAKQTAGIALNNLPALTQGFYHLWLKQGDNVTSLGQFTVNDQGKAVTASNQAFNPQLKTTDQAKTTLMVSIEASENPTQPSETIILSGEFKEGEAKLTFSAVNLSSASGVYTIAAPTDLSGEHQSSGIWFAKTDGHTLTEPGLSVPAAPAGWKYEAQLVYKEQIIAAGRFSQPSGRDNFGVFTPNPDNTPNFPGEDYLQGAPSRLGIDFPANLTSGEWKVIISLEPDQNGTDPTGDGTFFLQPFTATIAENTENYKAQSLTLDTSKFPTATISID